MLLGGGDIKVSKVLFELPLTNVLYVFFVGYSNAIASTYLRATLA